MRKFLKISALLAGLTLVIIIWWRYYFIFGEGVRAGNLNFFVKKGVLFKTWEGRLIQTGFKTFDQGSIQSNEFEFSVQSDSLAAILERASGQFVELRYKEYRNGLPWRGMSNYVIVEIINVESRQRPAEHPFE